MTIKRVLLQILLAAMLLAAQHGALTHQIRHVQDQQPLQSQQQDKTKQSAHSGLCPFHVSFAEVLGAVNSKHAPLQLAANAIERSSQHLCPAFPTDLVVPASRGPPVVL